MENGATTDEKTGNTPSSEAQQQQAATGAPGAPLHGSSSSSSSSSRGGFRGRGRGRGRGAFHGSRRYDYANGGRLRPYYINVDADTLKYYILQQMWVRPFSTLCGRIAFELTILFAANTTLA